MVKTAVSIPDPLFEAADRLAAQRKVSRSRLYAQALELLLSDADGGEVTERLDTVYDGRDTRLPRELGLGQARALEENW